MGIDGRIFRTVVFTLLLIVAAVAYSAAELPQRPAGPLADFAGVIDQDTRLKINRAARDLWVEYKVGLIVATVEHTASLALDDYTKKLAEVWGIGRIRGRSSFLVVVATNPVDVHILFSGADGTIHTSSSALWLSQFSGISDIRSGTFSDGVLVLTAELVRMVKTGTENPSVVLSVTPPLLPYAGVVVTIGVVCLLFIVVAVLRRIGQRHLERCGGTGFACGYTRGMFLSSDKK